MEQTDPGPRQTKQDILYRQPMNEPKENNKLMPLNSNSCSSDGKKNPDEAFSSSRNSNNNNNNNNSNGNEGILLGDVAEEIDPSLASASAALPYSPSLSTSLQGKECEIGGHHEPLLSVNDENGRSCSFTRGALTAAEWKEFDTTTYTTAATTTTATTAAAAATSINNYKGSGNNIMTWIQKETLRHLEFAWEAERKLARLCQQD